MTTYATLNKYPLTLLGDQERRQQYFSRTLRAYYFNRSRACFESILHYYQVPPHPFLPLPFPHPLPALPYPSLALSPSPYLPPLSLPSLTPTYSLPYLFPFPKPLPFQVSPSPYLPPLTLPLPVRCPSPVPHLSLALPSSNTSYQTGVECAPVNISTEQWNDEQQFYGMPTRNETVIDIIPATETKTGMGSSLAQFEYFARSRS